MPLLPSVLATAAVSLVSIVGVFLIVFQLENRSQWFKAMLAFAAGTLLGDTFIHLLPESIELADVEQVALTVLAGLAFSFVLEIILHQHHHDSDHQPSTRVGVGAAYLNLISDAIHNFLDGAAITASYIVSPAVGISTTIAIIFHEIPQELADAMILLHSGWSKTKVLLMNLLVALTAILGAVLAYLLLDSVEGLKPYLLPFAAGQFIYIACVDLIPQLLHVDKKYQHFINILLFGLGILIMFLLTLTEV